MKLFRLSGTQTSTAPPWNTTGVHKDYDAKRSGLKQKTKRGETVNGCTFSNTITEEALIKLGKNEAASIRGLQESEPISAHCGVKRGSSGSPVPQARRAASVRPAVKDRS